MVGIVSKFADKLNDWAASRGSPNTRAAYARDLSLWLDFCRGHKCKPEDPPPRVVVAFRDEMMKTRAPLTVRRTLACLSAAYASVLPTLANPFSERALPRPPASSYSRTQAVSDEDARAVLSAAALRGKVPARDVALIWVLWGTGMRRVSAVSIRREGVIARDGVTRLRHVVKGGEEVESELPPDAARAVAAWLEVAPRSPWLFCTHDGSAPLSPSAVTKIVDQASAAAGVSVHPHGFRSALITRALDAGISLERVRAAVHHKDIRSTLRYDNRERGAGVAGEVAAFRAKSTVDIKTDL